MMSTKGETIFEKAHLKVDTYFDQEGNKLFQFIVEPDYFTTLSEATTGDLYVALFKELSEGKPKIKTSTQLAKELAKGGK